MEKTASHYKETIPMMAAWGIIDLYSCIEEFIFELYRIYLNSHPYSLIMGKDYSDLRKLRRERNENPDKNTEWNKAWEKRLSSWQRKKQYDGLHKVFKSYLNITGLKTPSVSKYTTVESWVDSLRGIGELRNCLTHGVEIVTNDLSDFSTKPHSILFDFVEGESLLVELKHLQRVEYFLDNLITTINMSFFERAGYSLSDIISRQCKSE
jgi:hypothetical protein